MRKIIIALLLLYCSLISADDMNEYLRYVGFDVGQSVVGNTSSHNTEVMGRACDMSDKDKPNCVRRVELKSKHASQFLNVYSGFRTGDYAAFEFGAFSNFPDKKKHKGHTSMIGLHMGYIFMIPVTSRFEIVPGIGIAHTSVHVYQPKVLDHKEDGLIPRLVLGAQYRLSDKFKLRGSVIWHRTSAVYSDNLSMNNMINIGIGINYSFEAKNDRR